MAIVFYKCVSLCIQNIQFPPKLKAALYIALWRMISHHYLGLGHQQEQWLLIKGLSFVNTGPALGLLITCSNKLFTKYLLVLAWSSSEGDFVKSLAYSDVCRMARHGAIRKPVGVTNLPAKADDSTSNRVASFPYVISIKKKLISPWK